MARIEVETHVAVPPARVWSELVDWEGQARWMHDARSVVVEGDRRAGRDVVLRCDTDVLAGIVIPDRMVVTEWDPPHVLGVHHLGPIIRGIAAFELAATAHGTRVLWWEEIDPPLGAFGDAVATVAIVPGVRRTFRRSLAALKRRCEGGPE